MDQPTRKQLELKRIINEAFGVTEPNTLSELAKYTKVVGNYLLKGMETFGQLFKKYLHQKPIFNEGKQTPEQSNNEVGSVAPKRVGFRVNFSEFQCEESELQAVRQIPHEQTEAKPVRAFHFNADDIQEDQSMQLSSREDLSFFLSRFGTKRVKKDELNFQKQEPTEPFIPEKPEDREHWRTIYNKVNKELAVAMSGLKEKVQAERKKTITNDEAKYKNYVRKIGKDLTSDFGEPNKKLLNLMKLKRQRENVEMKPPRKNTHIEKETPQIYSVKRVLEVLEKQKDELMQRKRQELEEKLRAQREARRLEEEARERERRALQQRLQAQRRQEQQRARLAREQLQRNRQLQEATSASEKQTDIVQQKKDDEKSVLEVIEQRSQAKSEVCDEEAQIDGLAIRRNRNLENNDSAEAVASLSPTKLQRAEEPPSKPSSIPLFLTPTKEEPQPSEQKIAVPGVSEQKKKNNPFIKTSPAVAPSLQDLIKNTAKPSPFQALMASSSSSNLFNQTIGTASNLFASQTPQQQKQQPPPQLFNSPTNFMNNPIRPNFPQNGGPAAPLMPQFGSPNSITNNQTSSFQSSNANSSFDGGSVPQQGSLGSGGDMFNKGPSMGIGMFTNNPNAVKLFESNIFMNQHQPRSLFGEVSGQSTKEHASLRQTDRRKKPTRVI